jgi:hypothetical protein
MAPPSFAAQPGASVGLTPGVDPQLAQAVAAFSADRPAATSGYAGTPGAASKTVVVEPSFNLAARDHVFSNGLDFSPGRPVGVLGQAEEDWGADSPPVAEDADDAE